MLITIIADASFCPQTGAAGYGYWVACDRGKRGGSGYMQEPVANCTVAEEMALANALYHACKLGLVLPHDEVLLQTDSMGAICAFNGERKSVPNVEQVPVNYLRRLVAKMEITVRYKHVKGHTDGREPRLYINNQCDALAYEAMSIKRSQIKRQAREAQRRRK